MRPAAPSELSSLGDLHDADASERRRSSSRPLRFSVASTIDHGLQQPHQTPHYLQQQDERWTPDGEVPSVDLRGVSALLVAIGATLGMVLAIVVAQVRGARDAAFVHWLLLPGTLYANALLCVVLPSVLLNSTLATMHLAMRPKANKLVVKMLVCFVASTLSASVLGALLALVFVPTVSVNSALQVAVAAGSTSSPLLEFHCPQLHNSSNDSSRQALLVTPDGALRCAQPLEAINSTRFYVHDLAHTFQVSSTSTASIPTVREQLLAVFESLFPLNVLDAFVRTDVLSVLLIGAALGLALVRSPPASDRNSSPSGGSSLLFLLLVQADVALSTLTRTLLQALPVGMVFLVADTLLRSPASPSSQLLRVLPSTLELTRFVGTLLLALVLTLALVLAVATVRTKTSVLPSLQRLVAAQLVALGTSSSLLTLPVTVRGLAATRQVSMPLAHIVCSAGAVLNKTGTAAYVAVSSVYVVTIAGVHGDALTSGHVVALVGASVLASIVLPPVPRGSLLVVGTVLSSVLKVRADASGVHTLIAFLAAMDFLCDPLVTVVNVTSSAVVALVLASELDERFRDPSFGSTQEEETDDGLSGPRVARGPGVRLPDAPEQQLQVASIGNTSEVVL